MQATPLPATCRPSTGLPASNPTIRSASRLRSPEREAQQKAEYPYVWELGFFCGILKWYGIFGYKEI